MVIKDEGGNSNENVRRALLGIGKIIDSNIIKPLINVEKIVGTPAITPPTTPIKTIKAPAPTPLPTKSPDVTITLAQGVTTNPDAPITDINIAAYAVKRDIKLNSQSHITKLDKMTLYGVTTNPDAEITNINIADYAKKHNLKLKVQNGTTKLNKITLFGGVKTNPDATISKPNTVKYITDHNLKIKRMIINSKAPIGRLVPISKYKTKPAKKKPIINVKDFDIIKRSAGLYNRFDLNWYDKFSRFGCLDPYNTITGTKEYLFFTKPDLNIFANNKPSYLVNELKSDPFFIELNKRYINVLKCLEYESSMSHGPFIKILTEAVSNTLDMPTISAREIDTASNIYGTSMTYVAGSPQSDENHEFSLEFDDSRYIEVYMLFKAYEEYQRKKSKGLIAPKRKYTLNKIVHDQIAIYKFVVLEDYETILYYAKLTGCYPKSVPREAFSDPRIEGGLKFSVNWHAQFVEDMNPLILKEFNDLTSKAINKLDPYDVPIYNAKLNIINGDWVRMPYIYHDPRIVNGPGAKFTQYKLKWRG